MWVVRSLIRRLADRFATAVASRVVRILHERTDRSDAQYGPALATLEYFAELLKLLEDIE